MVPISGLRTLISRLAFSGSVGFSTPVAGCVPQGAPGLALGLFAGDADIGQHLVIERRQVNALAAQCAGRGRAFSTRRRTGRRAAATEAGVVQVELAIGSSFQSGYESRALHHGY